MSIASYSLKSPGYSTYSVVEGSFTLQVTPTVLVWNSKRTQWSHVL